MVHYLVCVHLIYHEHSTATFAVLRLLTQSSKQQRAGVRRASPPVGLEPTTFELEVQHASPLRHGGYPFSFLKEVQFQVSARMFYGDSGRTVRVI